MLPNRFALHLALLLLPHLALQGQNFFQNTYNNQISEDRLASCAVSNGETVTVGTVNAPNGPNRAWIQKLNNNGTPIWSKSTAATEAEESAAGVVVGRDGYWVACNRTDANGRTLAAGWLKLNNDGSLALARVGNQPCQWHRMVALRSGVLLVGNTVEPDGDTQALAIKIGDDGEPAWSLVFGEKGQDALLGAAFDADDSVYAVGYTEATGKGREGLLVKIGSAGSLLGLRQQHGGSGDDVWTDVAITPENRLFLAGRSNSFASVYTAMWVAVADLDGMLRWSKTLATKEQHFGADQVLPFENERFLVLANNPSPNLDNPSVLFNFNALGEYGWANRYRTTGELDHIRRVIATPNGFMTAGGLRSNGDTDAWLLSLNREGKGGLGCCPLANFSPDIKTVDPITTNFSPSLDPALRVIPWGVVLDDLQTAVKPLCIDVSFSTSDTSICIGECITLTLNGNTPSVIYTFDNPGAQGNPTQGGTLCYPTSGQFQLVRRGDNGFCKIASPPLLIEVSQTEDQFPNAFTPNGDEINDTFKPIFYCPVLSVWFRIYNRWGQLVFETRDPAQGWDGRTEGVEAPSDVYVWQLEYEAVRAAGRRLFAYKGEVTLLR